MKPSLFFGLIFVISLCWSFGTSTNTSLAIRDKRDTNIPTFSELFHRYKRDSDHFEATAKGADLVGKVAEVFGTAYDVKDVMKVGTQFLEKFGHVVKLMGPALGVVGIAFSLVAMFVPKEPSEELKAIEKGFKEMHGRFDQLSLQITQLHQKMDFYKSLTPYQEVSDNLANVFRDYSDLTENPSVEGFRNKFISACTDQKIEPSQGLEKLHRIIVKPTWKDLPHIAESVIKQYKLEYKIIMGIFDSIASDAYTLATLDSACYGMVHKNDSGLKIIADRDAKWVDEIIRTLGAYEKKLTDIAPEFHETLKIDLESALKTAEPDNDLEWSLHGECARVYSSKLTGSNKALGVCVGHNSVQTQKQGIYKHLEAKYPWLKWFSLVYIGAENGPISCSGDVNHFVNAKSDSHSVFATWSHPSLQEKIEKNVKNAVGILREAIPEEDQNWGQCRGGALTPTDVATRKAISEKLVIKDKGLFCSLGGNHDYHRSIITSGIGTYRSYYCTKPSTYTVDYIITYYAE